MEINTWREFAHIKSRLLELVDVLLEDRVLSREEIAADLLNQAHNLHLLEQSHVTENVIKKEMPRISHLAEEVEKKRMEREHL